MDIFDVFAAIGYILFVSCVIYLVAFLLFGTMEYLKERNPQMVIVGILGTGLTAWVLIWLIVAPFVG